jgi:hypothetical protein
MSREESAMSQTVKIIVLVLLAGALFLGGCSSRGGAAREIPWKVIDESAQPAGPVELFIKADAENRGALPVSIRAYGRDAKVLRRFKGKQFAQPTEKVLSLFFKGLNDWTIVDIKVKGENGLEAVRTMLYVLDGNLWRVGDSGTLLD